MIQKEKLELAKLNLDMIEKPCMPALKDSCPPNESCMFNMHTKSFQCSCPASLNYHRIEGECREYLPNMSGCELNLNECVTSLNEECLSLIPTAKHGTCQCMRGYKRNQVTLQCESLNQPQINQVIRGHKFSMPTNNRRRPSPPEYSPDHNEDDSVLDSETSKKPSTESETEFIQEIISELEKPLVGKSNVMNSSSLVIENKPVEVNSIVIVSSTTKSTTSSTRKTTTTSTTTTTTEIPSISTANLIANAGEDVHVW